MRRIRRGSGAAGSARLVSSTVAGTSDPWAAMPAVGTAGAISSMSPDASSGASAGAGENMNPNVDDPALAAPDAPYQLPDLNMLSHGQPHAVRTPANDRVIRALTSTFQQFNVDAKVVASCAARPSPSTRSSSARASRSRRSRTCSATSPTRWPAPMCASSRRSPENRRSASKSRTMTARLSTSATCCAPTRR